jgi:hypothetical protein
MKAVFFGEIKPANKPYYNTEVVGESFYQDNIALLVDPSEVEKKLKYKSPNQVAVLILDDNNEYDPGNAVRVEMEGMCVGYLPKHTAKSYRQALEKAELNDVIGLCNASVMASRRKKSEDLNYGVFLAIEPHYSLDIDEDSNKTIYYEDSEVYISNIVAIFPKMILSPSCILSVDIRKGFNLLSIFGTKAQSTIRIILPSKKRDIYDSPNEDQIKKIADALNSAARAAQS